jgi:hypothetical protein
MLRQPVVLNRKQGRSFLDLSSLPTQKWGAAPAHIARLRHHLSQCRQHSCLWAIDAEVAEVALQRRAEPFVGRRVM